MIIRNISMLAPRVGRAAIEALKICVDSGCEIEAFETFRTSERQAELFAQGRTQPGKIITHREFSAHELGLALDIAYFINGKWSWNGDFDLVGTIFVEHGFSPSPRFEKVHFEWPTGHSITDLQKMFKALGLQGLWEELALL